MNWPPPAPTLTEPVAASTLKFVVAAPEETLPMFGAVADNPTV